MANKMIHENKYFCPQRFKREAITYKWRNGEEMERRLEQQTSTEMINLTCPICNQTLLKIRKRLGARTYVCGKENVREPKVVIKCIRCRKIIAIKD